MLCSVALLLASFSAHAYILSEPHDVVFDGILCQSDRGIVRGAVPVAGLSALNRTSLPSDLQLQSQSTGKYARLTNKLELELDDWVDFTRFLRRDYDLAKVPKVMVVLHVKEKCPEDFKDEWASMRIVNMEPIRVLNVEVMTNEFMMAWRDLDDTLVKIVETSLESPGDEKRQKLQSIIEEGCKAIRRMADAEDAGKGSAAELAKEFDPDAFFLALNQRSWRKEWQSIFGRFCTSLEIGLAADLPPPANAYCELPVEKWLQECDTPAALVQRAKAEAGEESLLTHLNYSFLVDNDGEAFDPAGVRARGRNNKVYGVYYYFPVTLSMLPNVAPSIFENVRDTCLQGISGVSHREKQTKIEERPVSFAMESLGAVVAPVEQKVLGENLFLLAFRVKEVQAKGQNLGLRLMT